MGQSHGRLRIGKLSWSSHGAFCLVMNGLVNLSDWYHDTSYWNIGCQSQPLGSYLYIFQVMFTCLRPL